MSRCDRRRRPDRAADDVRLYSDVGPCTALLAGYRSPFDGASRRRLPVVWGGFLITNSETGFGAFTIAPRLHVQVCRNGLVMNASAMRRTRLGSRHDTAGGVITWSGATIAKTLELITSRTRDAVAAYLDTDYVTRMIRELETVSGTPVTDPDTTVSIIASKLKFTDDQQGPSSPTSPPEAPCPRAASCTPSRPSPRPSTTPTPLTTSNQPPSPPCTWQPASNPAPEVSASGERLRNGKYRHEFLGQDRRPQPGRRFGQLLLEGQPLEELPQAAVLIAGISAAIAGQQPDHPLLHVAAVHLGPGLPAGMLQELGCGEPLHRLGVGADGLGCLALGGQVQPERADLWLHDPGG